MSDATIRLSGGLAMPKLGQGTWRMGEHPGTRADEVRALQIGIDLGMTLIDTAEMYADAESIAGEAIRGRRDGLFLVSKVLPSNASRSGTVQACERSLAKLGVDQLDLYLLHWPGSHPLEDTLAAFAELVDQGKIRAYGVSNFDRGDMRRALAIPGGDRIVANQILYNLTRRGPEGGLIEDCISRQVAIMAYSPLEQARLDWAPLAAVARRHDATPAQIAIAWSMRHPSVVSIPKASDAAHVQENAGAANLVLTERDLADLDQSFPRKTSALECL